MTNITTLVTGFINISKYDNKYSNKSLEIYLEKGKKLIHLEIPKIIYIDEELIELLPKNEYTTYVPFDFKDLWLYNDYEEIKTLPNYRFTSRNKDTNIYFMIMNQKTDWVLKASLLNKYNTKQFMWIDFGIFHISNNDSAFAEKIIQKTNYVLTKDEIHAPSCNLYQYNDDELNKYLLYYPIWFFAGGMFMTNQKTILLFDSLAKEKIKNLLKKSMFTWENNIWYLVYKDFPNLFNVYLSKHDISMFF